MRIQTKIKYGLLLMAAILLLSVAMLPQPSLARYNTTVSWNTVIAAEEDPAVTPIGTPIFTGSSLTFRLTEGVTDPTCSIEKMMADQSYSQFSAGSLTATVVGDTVVIQKGTVSPPAGTYRLVITWQTEETAEVQTAAVTFFVNYSDG